MGAVDSLIGGIAQVGSTILTNQANKQENEQTRAYNLKMWQMENEYNTPAAQMARYMQAGLNPNLMYGSGSASSGNAGSPSPASPVHYQAPDINLPSVAAVLNQFQDYQNKEAQRKLIEQQTETEKNKTDITETNANTARFINRYNFTQAGNTNVSSIGPIQPGDPLWLKQQKLKIAAAESGIGLSNELIGLRHSENEMNKQLKEWNLTAADSAWARVLINLGNKTGLIGKFLSPKAKVLKNYNLPPVGPDNR